MKRKEKCLTMDESVEWLADLTEQIMVKCCPKERARRFRNVEKIIAAAKRKKRSLAPQYD